MPWAAVTWTPERLDRLRALAKDGHSASDIGKDLGVSRSAVLGCAFRNKITLGSGPGRSVANAAAARRALREWPRLKRGRPPKALAEFRRAESAEEPAPPPKKGNRTAAALVAPSLDVAFLDLKPGQCRYPYGDETPYRFCGHPADDGEVYCAGHMAETHNGYSAKRSAA